ncbi:hypothetical protein DENSPDRAFT_860514 [Dentipellis sp. KUC8613]|nr:hypothetical protein DENSPDRAFT_860514 [Dentipellis sp. KUC8613]
MSDVEHLESYRAADSEYLVRRGMTKGYELLSVLTPPVYAAFVLTRRGRIQFSINRLLRATWIGGAAGVATGGAFEYVRSANSRPDNLRSRRIRDAYDVASLRADDHSTIGGILGATLVPALFWKRGRAVHLVLGGAGLGSAVGLFAHFGRSLAGDNPPKRTSIPIQTPDSD